MSSLNFNLGPLRSFIISGVDEGEVLRGDSGDTQVDEDNEDDSEEEVADDVVDVDEVDEEEEHEDDFDSLSDSGEGVYDEDQLVVDDVS